MCDVLTFSDINATFFPAKSRAKVIDRIFAPEHMAGRIRCWIPWRAARRLQIIPDNRTRDHVPVAVLLPLVPYPDLTKASAEATTINWDRDRISACL
jgi:hypothetical protein